MCGGLVAAAIAIPFARRDDWVGRLSFIVLALVAVTLWAILLNGFVRSILAWARDTPVEPDDPRVGECYPGHIYMLSWNHESIAVRTHAGDPVVQVPLARLGEVIDLDALLLADDLTVRTPQTPVTFPKSRSERHKLLRLLGDVARSGGEVQGEVELRAAKFRRQSATWFPISLLTAALLLLPIFLLPDPEHVNLLWAVAGIAYALAWGWALRRFAYAGACFSGARKLRAMLRPKATTDPTHARG